MRRPLATIAIALTACAAPPMEDVGGDDGKADGKGGPTSAFVQANDPFYWANLDYAGFDQIMTSIGFAAHAPPLAIDDALTVRLQGHLDRIDALVRAHVERDLGAPLVAPKPQLTVLPSAKTWNAWVSPAVSCTGQRFDGTPATPTDPIGLLRSDAGWRATPYACVSAAQPGGEALRAFWNRARPACSLDSKGAVVGSKCTITGEGDGEVAILTTAPHIQITTDLVASLDEQAVFVVLAHELGHYYRAHVSDARVQRYDFWYETEPNRKKTPVPSSQAQQLQAMYAELVAGPKPMQSLRPGVYSPRLRTYLLREIAPILAERTEPDFVCAAARDALGPWTAALDHDAGLPTEAIEGYLAFEAKLAACAPQLRLGAEPGAGELSYGRIIMTVPAAKLKSITLPFFDARLSNVLDALDARAKTLDAKAARLTTALNQNRIGLYTIEQEADNLALRISVELGLSPEQVQASWLQFMGAIEAILPPEYMETYRAQEGGYDRAACQALYEKGFTAPDAQGRPQPVFIPLGQLDEPHHASCYRLFNFWREQKLKQYTPGPAMTFADGWDALRERARQASLAAQPAGF